MNTEPFKHVFCDSCPFIHYCPVEQRDALRYISSREGALIPKEEDAKFHAAMALAKKAAESCPGVVLIRELRMTESKKFDLLGG